MYFEMKTKQKLNFCILKCIRINTHLLFVKGLPEGTEWENSVSFMLVTGLGGLEKRQNK